MTRTPRRLTIASGLALLLLTGCGGDGARPGAAASVGETKISTSDLQGLVERGLEDPMAQQQLGADRAAYQRQALSRLINLEVLEEAASEQGVEVTDGDVDDQLAIFQEQAGSAEALEQQAAQSGIAAEDLPTFVRSIVLDQTLGDELTEDVDVPAAQLTSLYDENAAEYDQVRSRHILVADEATARRVLGQVQADRSRFEALAAELSTDTSNKDKGGDLGLAGRGQFVPPFEKAIFGAKEGDVVLVQTEFGWHVIEVQERQTTTLEEATPELRRAALREQRQAAVQELLKETSERLGVTVNPRFGRWDPETGTVLAEDSPNGVVSPGPEQGGAPGTPAPGEAPVEGEAPAEGTPQAPAEGSAPVEQPTG